MLRRPLRCLLLLALFALPSRAVAQAPPPAPKVGHIDATIHKVVNTDTMQLTIIGQVVKGDTLVSVAHMRTELASTKKDLRDVMNDYLALRAYAVKTVDSLKTELKKKTSCPNPATP
jgi:hypothetical protein